MLVDAGGRRAAKRILRDLEGHTVSAHALTHAHAGHQGSSHQVCTELGIPYRASERDADAAEDPSLIGERQPDNFIAQFFVRTFRGPGHPVDHRLRDGDDVAGFTVVDTPGHSRGHISLWRGSNRTLILGDAIANMDIVTGIPGLHEPKTWLTPDPEENRRSIRRLAPLEPNLALFGHGAPLRDAKKFADFCAGVP